MKSGCLKSFASGLMALASVLCAERALATDVSGTLSSDTTWSASGSPYVVTGSVLVSEGVKLNAVMAGSGVSILSYTRSPFGFSFDTGKDKSYTVEATGDLLKWNQVQTIQGTGSAVQFTDSRKALFEKQYYRVKTQQ